MATGAANESRTALGGQKDYTCIYEQVIDNVSLCVAKTSPHKEINATIVVVTIGHRRANVKPDIIHRRNSCYYLLWPDCFYQTKLNRNSIRKNLTVCFVHITALRFLRYYRIPPPSQAAHRPAQQHFVCVGVGDISIGMTSASAISPLHIGFPIRVKRVCVGELASPQPNREVHALTESKLSPN